MRATMMALALISIMVCTAQGQVSRDDLKQAVATHTMAIANADSIGDDQASIDARIALAPLLKPLQEIRLLEEAATIARSANLAGAEVNVRKLLGERHRARGDHRKAYTEAERVIALQEETGSRSAEQVKRKHEEEITRIREDLDRWGRALDKRMSDLGDDRDLAQLRTKRWMFVSLGVGLLFLLVVAFLLFRIGRVQRNTRGVIDSLKGELRALNEVRGNTVRTAVVAAPLSPPAAPVAVEGASMDAVLLGMFRKQAPERLETLKAARGRGDIEKVLRVVHSLRPQLANIDPHRSTDLCAAITAPGAHEDAAQWNADLDALEAGVEAALRASDPRSAQGPDPVGR